MKTRFIGLEGFNEIESLSTAKKGSRAQKLNTAQKTIRFIKRAAKMGVKAFKSKTNRKPHLNMSVIDKRFNADRRGAKSEYSCSAREAVSGFTLKSGKAYAHCTSSDGRRAHTIIKKKAVLAVVACMSAIVLSCATVASALDYPNTANVQAKPEQTSATVQSTQEEATVEPATLSFGSATADEPLEVINNSTHFLIDNLTVGLYIDGELIGVTSNAEALKNALSQVLVDYRSDYDEQTTTEFANSVEIKPVSFSNESFMTSEEIMAKAQDKLSISLSTDIVYSREVSYETKTEYDESQYSSYEEVKTEGKNGEELVTIRTTFVDGVQTDAVETGTKTLKAPVDEVIIKGSLDGEMPASSSDSYKGSSGAFCWPMPYTHNITSYYGYRWGTNHNGIDISAGGIYGESIVAADGGTVTFAGYDDSGYGYYVVIDHGNGYSTLYGHCSSVAVSSGQQVSQGEVVGYVGSTGFSTGPHLHFEIRVDGEKVDPLGYVS